ncbi:MAG: GSCFA domain-containing protein [Bacteroidia bacterium]|nr:GSCFA domain-containing protein [Bacteroidia bacterium]
MKFRSEIIPEYPPHLKIKPNDSLLFTGSCFSEEIGSRSYRSGWKVYINPIGIHFHPLVHGNLLLYCLKGTLPEEDFIIERNGLYFSLYHHSDFHDTNKDKLLDKIKIASQHLLEGIKSSKFIFITFGTAFYFFHKERKIPVANCHKIPADSFVKKLSEPEAIISQYDKIIKDVKKINPQAILFLTVSPVRYLRHGITENLLSKSILIFAANKLKEVSGYQYFPSYELVTEDLKDYRFYKPDLMHPNDMAVDYVWEKFLEALAEPEAIEMSRIFNDYYKMLDHKQKYIYQEHNIEKEKFTNRLNSLRQEISEKYPWAMERNEFHF